jgi:hypothetical protein
MPSKNRDSGGPKVALQEKLVATNAPVTLKGDTPPYRALQMSPSVYDWEL